MNEELDILQKIAKVSGKNDKQKLLRDNRDNSRLGELLDAGLNFFRKFHINKLDLPDFASPTVGEVDLHDSFLQLLSKLERKELTGNSARTEAIVFFIKCSERQQEIYYNILRKDMKIGVSVDTAAEFFNIPTFDVMLATDGKKCKQLNNIISKGVFVSPKFDGYRCLAVIENGDVTLYSRNGSEFDNFPSIKQSLSRSFPKGSIVLDGEIMSDDFQAMQKSAFASKRGTTVGDVKFHVFDYIPVGEWQSGAFIKSKSERYQALHGISAVFDSNFIKLVQQEFTKDIQKVIELETAFTKAGYEGAMVVPDIPYYRGRSANKLMKFKTMQSQDCIVAGFYEGNEGTRNEGRLGGFKLIQENGEICECGTGFSDEDRELIWTSQDKFIGRIAEIKFQELTKDGVMRFPVFVRWRDQLSGGGKI